LSQGTIIYIGGFELPDKNAAAHRVLSNGKIMRELGYKVVFIGVDKSSVIPQPVAETRQEVQGFESWSVHYPRNKRQWMSYLSSIKSFEAVAARYSDLKTVICYNYPALALQKLKKYCHGQGVKIISDCTEWFGTEGDGLIYKILKGTDTWLRMHIIQKRLDGLIVISKYLEEYYAGCSNLIRIPPLVDVTEAKWHQIIPEEDQGPIRFVYAGDGAKDKDRLNLVIEALHRLGANADYRFYVVGVSKERYLQNYSHQSGLLEELGDKVIFLGRLPHLESLRYVKMADFNLFHRVSNRLSNAGFPTKFVESITCGVPVITSRTSNIEDYLKHGENGFYLERDISATLNMVLNLKKSDRNSMKSRIDCDTFDYHAYLEPFRGVLKSRPSKQQFRAEE